MASRKSFADQLASMPVLTPVMLGLASAIVLWAVSREAGGQYHTRLALFVAGVGLLGGFGTLMTMLVLKVGQDPELNRRHQELDRLLEKLASGPERRATPECSQRAVEAAVERL